MGAQTRGPGSSRPSGGTRWRRADAAIVAALIFSAACAGLGRKAVLDSVPDEQRTVCHRRRARVMGAAEPHPGGVLILSAAAGAGHVRAA